MTTTYYSRFKRRSLSCVAVVIVLKLKFIKYKSCEDDDHDDEKDVRSEQKRETKQRFNDVNQEDSHL